MIDVGEISRSIFSVLKGVEKPVDLVMFTGDGERTLNPEAARYFYSTLPNIMILIDSEDQTVALHKNENIPLEEIDTLIDNLRVVVHGNFYTMDVKNFGKTIEPKDYVYMLQIEKDKNITESTISRMFGSRKTSRQKIGEVCLVVKHNREVNDEKRGSRSRNINEIFIEHNGIREKFPCKLLSGARAMARHIANEGTMDDKVGSNIVKLSEHYVKLREFITYVRRNKLINEQTTDIIVNVKDNLKFISEKLKRFTGSKSYHSEAQKCEEQDEVIVEVDDDLRDKFTIKIFNERLDDVLPVVADIMNSRNTFLEKVEEAASGDVYITNKPSFNGLMFETSEDELSYKIQSLADSIIGNDSLVSYLSEMVKKVKENRDLSSFDKNILEKTLTNISIFEAN